MGTNKAHGEYNVKISDEVIAVCAVNATLKTEGVAAMVGGIPNALSRNLLGKELLAKGIKVNQTEEGVEVDVYINVEYRVKIPAVAWDIQENVKKEIQSMTELNVKAVNIHVQGVKIPSEDKKPNDEK